ncbi:hypothetical protein [Streptantibioticus ferralitis]|uniref:Uncharacterized protein n=1 Tax=Streptantibioticus ferralitis TaxID=236510 RepID=A0ABT5Z6Q8_9ACTN|nr:hypothetical protein [Streptantibioticus ferralitis]MDF2259505.1 hypothetical protein [Streptantibioticus ferralitis]
MTLISEAEFDQAAELHPRHLQRYLRSRGWTFVDDYGRGQLWELAAASVRGEPYEVMVPLDRRPRDYPDRVCDLLEALAAVESRRPGEVLREMALPPADWQYLRLLPPGPSGTAPLVDLVPALTGLKDLMTAAAAAACAPEPQPVQPAQKPQRVKDFVASVRLDQTRVGSYVLAAHTPLPEPSTQGVLPFDDSAEGAAREPFERLVSRRLYAATWCAYQAAERTIREDTLDDFAQYAAVGLSANLCEALVRIAGDEARGYELSFAWAAELPVGHETPSVAVTRPLLRALEAGAQDLRARLSQRGVAVRGNVVRLDRTPTAGPGEVTVLGSAEGEEDRRPRRYRVVLQQRDYAQAASAHQRGLEVTVRGDLVVRGGHARLDPVTGFETRQAAD